MKEMNTNDFTKECKHSNGKEKVHTQSYNTILNFRPTKVKLTFRLSN